MNASTLTKKKISIDNKNIAYAESGSEIQLYSSMGIQHPHIFGEILLLI